MITTNIEDPQKFTKRSFELIIKSSNISAYKINGIPVYQLTEEENRKKRTFTVAPRKTNYLGINLTKE